MLMEGAPGATEPRVARMPDDPRLHRHSLRRRSHPNLGGGQAAAAESTQAPTTKSAEAHGMFCNQRLDASDEAPRRGCPRVKRRDFVTLRKQKCHSGGGRTRNAVVVADLDGILVSEIPLENPATI